MQPSISVGELVLIAAFGLIAVESTRADTLTLTPMQPPIDLRSMCERYPGSCTSAPIPVIINPAIIQILPYVKTTCINGMLYKEVPAKPHEYPTWALVTTSAGENIACK